MIVLKAENMSKTHVALEVLRQTIGQDCLELAFVLGYVASRNHLGKPTRFIDLVYAETFGNGSKVSHNLQRLEGKNLISFVNNNATAWEKSISVTEIGFEWLGTIETDILSVLTTLNSNRTQES